MYQVTNNSTEHGLETTHGIGTPHRLPGQPVNTPVDFFKMVELLYPTGTAWNLPENRNFSNLHSALNLSLLQVALDAAATLDDTFPDNANFDASDCDLWEYRFGIEFNPALSTAQRRQNIYNAMAFPQNILGRQSPSYIESSLRDAGFDVHIYENIFFDGGGNLIQKTPAEILGTIGTITQLRQIPLQTQLGSQTQLGGGSFTVIANSEQPETYNPGGILWPTFFISGNTISTPANVSQYRQTEFRRLVLKLKPAHTMAFLIVNFV